MVALLVARFLPIADDDGGLPVVENSSADAANLFDAHGACDGKPSDAARWNGLVRIAVQPRGDGIELFLGGAPVSFLGLTQDAELQKGCPGERFYSHVNQVLPERAQHEHLRSRGVFAHPPHVGLVQVDQVADGQLALLRR